MNIKLLGVSLAELELALKYSGLYVEAEGNYAEIKAIPEFLRTNPSTTQCRCDAAKQLQGIKTKAREKVKHLQEQVEEMGYKVTELAVHLGKKEVVADKRLADIEFWEVLQNTHEASKQSEEK
jgi:hypothetical protein